MTILQTARIYSKATGKSTLLAVCSRDSLQVLPVCSINSSAECQYQFVWVGGRMKRRGQEEILCENVGKLCMEELLRTINEFRAWQAARFPGRNPREISGEWETWYEGWSEINTAFRKVLQETEPEATDKHLLDEMIYIIARDNECELLMEDLIEYPEWFSALCQHSLSTEEADAKW